MSSKSHTACERGASSRVHMSLVVFFFLFLASSQTQFENHMCASCSWLLALRSSAPLASRAIGRRACPYYFKCWFSVSLSLSPSPFPPCPVEI